MSHPHSEEEHLFIGTSPLVRELAARCRATLPARSPVLILGEAGTGKGSLARWLHRHGPCAEGPFVGLSCAGIQAEAMAAELFGRTSGAYPSLGARPGGLFEKARGGSLFLDEVGELDAAGRAILEGLPDRTGAADPSRPGAAAWTGRLLLSASQDLTASSQGGRSRGELALRIGATVLHLSPLRKRLEDIPLLAERFLDEIGAALGKPRPVLTHAALEELRGHRWAGNLRELNAAMERAMLACAGGSIRPEHLRLGASSWEATPDTGTRVDLADLEAYHTRRVIEEEGGRLPEAARRLGIPVSVLQARLLRMDRLPEG